MMVNLHFLQHVADREVDAMGNKPDGWNDVKAVIQTMPDSPSPFLWMFGHRVIDSPSTGFFVVKELEYEHCDGYPETVGKYIAIQVQNAYLSLMTYTSCGCRFRPSHDDDEGSIIVPAGTEYCEQHAPKGTEYFERHAPKDAPDDSEEYGLRR